jgi:hypothetical protein
MFSDPISLTLNGVSKSLARILTDGRNAVYQTSDASVKLEITHVVAKATGRITSTVKFTETLVVTNPIDSTNDEDFQYLSIQFHRPKFGFAMTKVEQIAAMAVAWLTNANVDKIYGGEI